MVRRAPRSLVVVAAHVLFVLFALACTRRARAEPWFGWRDARLEERFADGEFDAEDLVAMRLGRGQVGGSDLRARSWLTLKGFYGERPSGLVEWGGMIVVGLALDKIAAGPVHRTRDPVQFADGAAPPANATAPPSPSPTPTAASSSPAPPQPILTSKLARSCVAAAWRASGLGTDDSRIDAIVSRAHMSALLPETRLRAMRVFLETARVNTTTTSSDPSYYDSAGANLWLEARLTWRLDRLLYADDEPTLERVRIERHDARARVSARVLEALFLWQRAVLDAQTTADGTREHLEASLRAFEAEATLDVLTNGWFAAWRRDEIAAGRGAPP